MIVWIIGLAGAGKTTFATALYDKCRLTNPNILLADGDNFRGIMAGAFGYSLGERQKNGLAMSNLCKWLDENKINVIVPILSNFIEQQKWNRHNFSDYYQVYIPQSMEVLRKRDQKGLYSGFNKGETCNVVGLDIVFNEPIESDFVINGNEKEDPAQSIYISLKDRLYSSL
jgi:cytidine diphosphoramidate kinase